MKRFYVSGTVKATRVGKDSDFINVKTGSFGQSVYAEDAKSARDIVLDKVWRKWAKGNNIYVVKEVKFVEIDVYERVMSFQAFEEVGRDG